MSGKGSPPARPYSFFRSVATYVVIGLAVAVALHMLADAWPQFAHLIEGGAHTSAGTH
jgi:hypothetical protein